MNQQYQGGEELLEVFSQDQYQNKLQLCLDLFSHGQRNRQKKTTTTKHFQKVQVNDHQNSVQCCSWLCGTALSRPQEMLF